MNTLLAFCIIYAGITGLPRPKDHDPEKEAEKLKKEVEKQFKEAEKETEKQHKLWRKEIKAILVGS